jgi:IS605 OrfB family transposase
MDVLKAQITKANPYFHIKLRSRKDNYVTVFGKRDFEFITQDTILGELKDKTNQVVKAPPSQFKIIYNKSLDQWKLYYTIDNDIHPKYNEDQDNRRGILCLDPGINMFQTGVNLNTMSVVEYGTLTSLKQYIIPFVNRAEKLNRLLKVVKHTYLYPDRKQVLKRMSKNMMRLYTKASLRMTDAHYCIALNMCLNFKTIIIPDFKVKQMAKKGKLSKSMNKDFVRWSHYQFKQILIRTARRTNTIIIESKEPYTSQTCCLCRKLVKCKGSVFECKECKLKLPRDWNGGLNNNIVLLSP